MTEPSMQTETRFPIAIFPREQYLGDENLRQAVARVASTVRRSNLHEDSTLRQFHPMGPDSLKNDENRPNMDLVGLSAVDGHVVRTRVIIKSGIRQTNPPPEDYHCDSCHTKGWLKKEFQNSKLDGANVAVWLCLECSKLDPDKRDIRF